ncbi:hypothetical protein ACPOL_7193 (plasmid) [Acidisarcina polymorpha]|uniref:Uncharacterized protein n=1 Tax=Acidisarcina polymorpha TaxID=2211140 RepID=A0A2Z5GAZ6_9BACT|nr:hypothetical protein [Acidisarcina polymorpha]AXC16383.1 hypothetical protein ACPOL_7193 [Acidisarcina polymorpha]
MQSDPIEEISEAGEAYWRHRAVILQILVAQLLEKNQNMRFNLEAIDRQRSKVENPDS